jgi:phosphomannomutase
MENPLVFGTDGWRGEIAHDFTFQNVRRVSLALARVLKPRSTVAVGFDFRFLSEEFAREAAGVLAAHGHRVWVVKEATTSPALSFSLKRLSAAAGVMITASHNPPSYNGFKIKVPPGRSADPTFTAQVEGMIEAEIPPSNLGAKVDSFSPNEGYVKALLSRLELKWWREKKTPLAVDAMHGSGGPVWEEIFRHLKLKGEIVRGQRDPLFGGIPPEPIEPHLAPLVEAVRRTKAVIGVGVDGDADRLGVIDDTGAYLPPHTVFPLLFRHLVQNRRLKGPLVQATSMGYLSERMAKTWGVPVTHVPVGYKHVADEMARCKTLLGGEESGGYGVGVWGLERDGILSGLLLMELVLAEGKPLSVLRQEMYKEFGVSDYQRVDLPLRTPIPDRAAWEKAVAQRVPEKLTGKVVRQKKSGDGLKIILEDGSWLLLRPSGTEPLLRTYAETPDPVTTAQLLRKAQEWAGTKIGTL